MLILDDCLSAVDVHTEEKILGHLDRVGAGVTRLVISTRLSAVRAADEILVLDEGRIVERGLHDDLVCAGGLYATLWERQDEGDSECLG